ncbi:MAG: NUDIX domain-containing protein [Minisyncoccia bacterium]
MDSKKTRSAGGIVLGDSGTIALVRHTHGNAWTFPKGHVDEGETDEMAAQREMREEAGLSNCELLDDLGTYERGRISLDGKSEDTSELKEIHMFLFAAEPHAKLAASMEIAEAAWVPFREAAHVLSNVKDRVWFASVFERVREAIQRD